MTTVNLQKPASEKMITWQTRKLYGQLALLQEHSSDSSCPCELTTEHEFCVPKHCVHIQSLAEESATMAEGELRDIFSRIAGGANDLRRAYEEAREAGKEPPYSQIAEFAREARKELEPFLWKYKSKREHAYELAQAEPRWCLLQGRRVASRQPHRLEITGSIPAPATNSDWCYNNNGDEVKMATDKSICRQLGRLLKEEPWGSDMLRDYSLRLEYQAKQAAECPKIQREAYERAAIVRNAITSLMQATYKKGSEVQMKQDPILAETTRQICSTGVCFAKSPELLPICSPIRARKLDRCIKKVEKRNIEGGFPKEGLGTKEAPIPYAVCRSALKCRLGGKKG